MGTGSPMEFAIAMTEDTHEELQRHLDKGPDQEDLTFAAWRPSSGLRRLTAVISRLVLPGEGDRILQGNVAFTTEYLQRVLAQLDAGEGLALIHGHPAPGWQGMSDDDVVAERDRLAGAAFGRTNLPLVGLTAGTDGAWSGRRWLRVAVNRYDKEWAHEVRVVGRQLRLTYHPKLRPTRPTPEGQVATVSVWGEQKQADLVRCRVGLVGLGSVGSLVAECLARIGISDLVLIDPDRIEERNLDRTAGATSEDARARSLKVEVAERNISRTATSPQIRVEALPTTVLGESALKHVLDCDVIFSCVDRPWPRHLLNALAYAHLIPVVDGGILARVDGEKLVHTDWRIHTVGPGHACMVCLGALDLGDVALDIEGKLDDPDYIKNLPDERRGVISRRNVFPFSMSVAAHEVLQFVGLITGLDRIGGVGPQTYHGYPGTMEVRRAGDCRPSCPYNALSSSAADLTGNFAAAPIG